MWRFKAIQSSLSVGILLGLGQAQPCDTWGIPKPFGVLEAALPEQSGMAFSSIFPERIYHINDSGRGNFFYVTDDHGARTVQVGISGFSVDDSDFEALSTAAWKGKNYIVVADIGNNAHSNRPLHLLFFEEKQTFSKRETPVLEIDLHYPSGTFDAEGMSVHPSGDLYILTKEWGVLSKVQPTRMFRLKSSVWKTALTEKTRQMDGFLEAWGSIDFQRLAPSVFDLPSRIATDLAIAPDGQHFVVLTYKNAFEFAFDLSKSPLPEMPKNAIQKLLLTNLEQQEAIAYTPKGELMYTSERQMINPPLMYIPCLKFH
ncbi:MAG: hypothetical protein U0Z75_06510 [Deinococcaceae bacterium]